MQNIPDIVVTDVKVFTIDDTSKKTKAFANVILSGQMQLTMLRIVEGAGGLFVAYPNDTSHKGHDYRTLFYPLTKALRDQIEEIVLDRYRDMVKGDG